MFHSFRDELNNLKEMYNYSLGKPWRNSKKSQAYVIPIIKKMIEKRRYVMLDELKAGKDYIINDTGVIDSLTIENKIKTPIFIRTGAMLTGPTQNRAVVYSIIVAPGETASIRSRCIHASSPIHSSSCMSSNCYYVPDEVQKNLRKGQSATWGAVADFSLTMDRSDVSSQVISGGALYCTDSIGYATQRCEGASIPIINDYNVVHDDLASTTKEAYKAVKESPCYDNQVGMIIVDTRGIRALEIYDSDESWGALHKRVLEKYKTVLTNQADTDIFKLDMDALKKKLPSFIDDVLNSKEETVETGRAFKTRYLEDVSGEYTVIRTNGKHKFIHVIASNKELHGDEVKETYKVMY